MAHALAATCPPLQSADVLQLADRLSEQPATPEVVVTGRLFGWDVDRVQLGNVIEALHALHQLR
jgi:hypothetical protein